MNKINLLLLCLSLGVGACGFEPLYVQRDKTGSWYFGGKTDVSIAAEMAQIKVSPIEDRFGQMLRNNLLDLLTPKGVSQSPKYVLKTKLVSKEIVQQAMRRDITATNERVTYSVEYQLFQDSEPILSSDSVAYVSYDILANPYSTTMAQKKTEADAAKIIANDIALRLGAYFHSLQNKKADLSDI